MIKFDSFFSKELIGDYVKVIHALLGGAKDVAQYGGRVYLGLLRTAILPTSVLIVFGITAFVLSDQIGNSLLNFVGVLIFGLVFISWLILAIPIFGAVSGIASFDPARRLLKQVSFTLLFLFSISVFSLGLPAGASGVVYLGIYVVMSIGLLTIGLQITRMVIGIQLVLFAAVAGAAILFPLSLERISDSIGYIDNKLSGKLTPVPIELPMTIAVLQREVTDAPPLFTGGNANWWCRPTITDVSGYRCFGEGGKDRTTNEELVPLTNSIIESAISNLNKHELRVQEGIAAATLKLVEDERQRKIELEFAVKQEAAASRQDYIDKYVLISEHQPNLLVSIQNGDDFDLEIQNVLVRLTEAEPQQPFHKRALQDQVFRRIFELDADEFKKIPMGLVANSIYLGFVTKSFSANTAVRGSFDASLILRLILLETQTNAVVWEKLFVSDVLGHNKELARLKARKEILSLVEREFNN